MTRFGYLAVAVAVMLGSGCTGLISATTDQPINADPTERSLGNVIDDQWIETKAVVNIQKSHPLLEHAHIVAVSYNGVLLLAGQAPTAEARRNAAETASMLKNVRRVHNEITIGPNSSLVARSSDALITSKIKTKLFANGNVDGGAVKVVTEHGTVYLMGLASREQADLATRIARNTGGVQKVVRIFEYIED